MRDLFKADLLRIVKDKMFLVLCIIFCAFGVIVPLFYFGIIELGILASDGDQSTMAAMKQNVSSISLALTSFSPFSGICLLLGIFMSILIWKDLSQGTLRNKIITGHSRLKIYASQALATLIIVLGLVLAYVIICFLVGSIFFNPGFTWNNIGSYMGTFFLEILGWIVLSLAITFFSMCMKNAGGAIVLYLVIGIALTSGGEILLSMASFMDSEKASGLIGFINVLNGINIPFAMSVTLSGSLNMLMGEASSPLSWDFLVEYIISSLVFISAFAGFGYLIFNNKDLK